MKELEDFLLS